MLTWININTKQIIRWGIAIAFGSLITICVDFTLVHYLYIPRDWNFYPFSSPKIIAVALGSMFSGIVSRKYGWLIGVIIAVIFFMFIAFMFFPTSPWRLNQSIVFPSHPWTSFLPTGMFMIITGLICGYLGGRLSQKIKIRRK